MSTIFIDYKKELETASKGMIMIHDPKLLIKLIVRMIVRKLKIKHAGMILYEPEKEAFVLSISRGEKGVKIPPGFTRFHQQSPLIQIFLDKRARNLIEQRNALVQEDITRLIWRETVIDNGDGEFLKDLLHRGDEQMKMLNAEVCVPAFYQNDLLAVLLLGEKCDGTRYDQDELDFFAALASDAAMAIRNGHLINDLKREARRNRELFIQTIIVLGSTIEAKDKYTHGHTERVTNYSLSIARQMVATGQAKFEENFFESLYISGLLHDIGKIAVPESILNKEGRLTDEEFTIMKSHTVKGHEMVKPLNLAQDCVDGIRHHHERYDGKGYPDGLTGENIPISAAVMAVADTFDAMTSDRPYRKGLAAEVAMKEIEENIGTQFNPVPAKAMLELYRKGYI